VRWGGDIVHKRRLGYLLSTEPPVVVIRVLRVIEAPTRRGLALSHVSMLTLTREAVANQEIADFHTDSLQIAAYRQRPSRATDERILDLMARRTIPV